jgi:hypothetical protein
MVTCKCDSEDRRAPRAAIRSRGQERIECARNGAGSQGAGAQRRDAIVVRAEIIADEGDTSARDENSRLVRELPRCVART